MQRTIYAGGVCNLFPNLGMSLYSLYYALQLPIYAGEVGTMVPTIIYSKPNHLRHQLEWRPEAS